MMEHAEMYNELNKRMQALETSKKEEMDSEEAQHDLEEYENLKFLKEKLEAHMQPDEDDEDQDFVSISYSMKVCLRILRFLQLL